MSESTCVNEFRVTGILESVREKTYKGNKTMQIGVVKTELPDRNGPAECEVEFAFFGFMAERAKELAGSVVTVTGQIQSKNGFTNLRAAQLIVDTPAVFGGVNSDDEGETGIDDEPEPDEEIPF